MKKINIFFKAVLFCFLLNSCLDPEEDRIDIPVTGVKINLDYSVTQKQGYDNWIYLESKTAGAIPFWDYKAGVSNKMRDTVLQPFAGKWWVKYYAYTHDGPVLDSTQITVTDNDRKFFHHKYWNLLTNGAAGKTWVWAYDNKDFPGTTRGIGSYKEGSTYKTDNWDWTAGYGWWKAGQSDNQDGEITFDLNQAANFTKTIFSGAGSGVTKGLFSLDTINYVIKLQGATMINSEGDSDGSYKIARLTEDELIICQIYSWGGQRPYHFKRKGYVYP